MITRPSKYTHKIGAEICRRIAGGETLLRITGPKRRRGMVSRMTVYQWLKTHRDFRETYRLARLAQAELFADQMIDIADGAEDEEPLPREVRRDRLRCDVRRWQSMIIAPAAYDDRMGLLGEGEEVTPDEEAQHQAFGAARIAAIFEAVRQRRIEVEGETPELVEQGRLLALIRR